MKFVYAFLALVLIAKLLENLLGTAKTILIQKNRAIFAALTNTFATYVAYVLTGIYVKSDSEFTIIALAVGAGIGTYIAILINDRLSKDKTYINVILSSDKEELIALRDYLVDNDIISIATDAYTKDWEHTLALTVYAETKAESRLLDEYLSDSPMKFKRIVKKH